MPIHCRLPIACLSREEFLERDALVMKCAYATQNKLGRLCDERVYETDLANRLRAAGMRNVETQIPVRITHRHFVKDYRIDLIADNAIYELKTVTRLTTEHDCQVLNYAMCLNIRCIKLLNFRNAKVEGLLRFAPVDESRRHHCRIDTAGFRPATAKCPPFLEHLTTLIADIGGFLEARLYEEALGSLNSAPEERLPVTREGIELGTHAIRMLSPGVAFYVSAFTDSINHQRTHLQRLLACLPLTAVHWINFNHQHITLETVCK